MLDGPVQEVGQRRLTCRYFAISPTTFYIWLKHFIKADHRGLEGRSLAPELRRIPGVAWQTVEPLVSLRKEHPAWSKHKIGVLSRMDHGIFLPAPTVGRILKRRGLYGTRATAKRKRAARRARRRQRAARWGL